MVHIYVAIVVVVVVMVLDRYPWKLKIRHSGGTLFYYYYYYFVYNVHMCHSDARIFIVITVIYFLYCNHKNLTVSMCGIRFYYMCDGCHRFCFDRIRHVWRICFSVVYLSSDTGNAFSLCSDSEQSGLIISLVFISRSIFSLSNSLIR